MRWWPFRRRAVSRVVFVGGSPFPAAAASPRPAVPPLDAVPSPAAAVSPPPLPPLDVTAPPPPPYSPPPPTPVLDAAAVRLGFADGSELALPSDDPAVAALRDAADRLTTRG